MVLLFIFLHSMESVFSSPCTLHAAPDGRYHFLQNREERTVSAYIYWKQASTLVNTIQGLLDYGVCETWATGCLNGVCQGVPACDIRQKDGKWAIFREGHQFSPYISDKEGGQEYLAEIFSNYKAAHICYETSTMPVPVFMTLPRAAGTSVPTPTLIATPTATPISESELVIENIEVPTAGPSPSSSPASVSAFLPTDDAAVVATPPALVAPTTAADMPVIDLMSAPTPSQLPPAEAATSSEGEDAMDADAIPVEAFDEKAPTVPQDAPPASSK